MTQKDKKLLRLANLSGLHNSLWSDPEIMPAIFETFKVSVQTEEKKRMMREILNRKWSYHAVMAYPSFKKFLKDDADDTKKILHNLITKKE